MNAIFISIFVDYLVFMISYLGSFLVTISRYIFKTGEPVEVGERSDDAGIPCIEAG